MDLLRLFRPGDRSSRRLQARRRPLVEALEGRRLLSTLTLTAPAVQGGHIGSGIASDVAILRKH
jgi:hypothetical protein